MSEPSQTPLERLDTLMWSTRLDELPIWQSRLVWLARLVYAVGRDLTLGYLSLQAMSLVYTTLLSLVPLLAVSFSVLKGFGAHDALHPLLLSALEPLGALGGEIAERIFGFVDNMRVGVLGSLGMAMLLYTVITLIGKIEQVLNYTWRTEESRPFAQRFSQYLSVILIGPVLFFSAVGLSASIGSTAFMTWARSIQPMGFVIDTFSQIFPYLLISLTFAFIYVFVPNARVRFVPALIGALVAGLLWQSVGWLFAHSMASSTQYTAIYSGLAILILFMIWIYIAWLILLVGASIAFYIQNPEYLTTPARELRLSNRLRERLALLVAGHIARNYLNGSPPWTKERLSAAFGLPKSNARRVLVMLEDEGFLLRTADDPPCYVPARAPETTGLRALLDAVRCYEEHQSGCRGTAPDPGIVAIESRIEAGFTDALANMTLRDLADSLHDPRPAVQEPGAPAGAGPRAGIAAGERDAPGESP